MPNLMPQSGASAAPADIQAPSKQDVLCEAISQGDLARVTYLLSGGADANAHDSRGRSPLETAITKNNCKIVSLLLQAGANVHASVRGHSMDEARLTVTPLHLAVLFIADQPRDDQIALQLLKAGANPLAYIPDCPNLGMERIPISATSTRRESLLETPLWDCLYGARGVLKNRVDGDTIQDQVLYLRFLDHMLEAACLRGASDTDEDPMMVICKFISSSSVNMNPNAQSRIFELLQKSMKRVLDARDRLSRIKLPLFELLENPKSLEGPCGEDHPEQRTCRQEDWYKSYSIWDLLVEKNKHRQECILRAASHDDTEKGIRSKLQETLESESREYVSKSRCSLFLDCLENLLDRMKKLRLADSIIDATRAGKIFDCGDRTKNKTLFSLPEEIQRKLYVDFIGLKGIRNFWCASFLKDKVTAPPSSTPDESAMQAASAPEDLKDDGLPQSSFRP